MVGWSYLHLGNNDVAVAYFLLWKKTWSEPTS